MVNLEQAKLLETKVAKAIDYIQVLSKENAALRQKETELRQKEAELQAVLESYQSRIDELEILVMRFKEDQGIIEDSILAALDRLNQFEEAIEKCIWDAPSNVSSADFTGDSGKTSSKSTAKPVSPPPDSAEQTAGRKSDEESAQDPVPVEDINSDSGNDNIFFEIQETEGDIIDPLEEAFEKELQAQDGELDIF